MFRVVQVGFKGEFGAMQVVGQQEGAVPLTWNFHPGSGGTSLCKT